MPRATRCGTTTNGAPGVTGGASHRVTEFSKRRVEERNTEVTRPATLVAVRGTVLRVVEPSLVNHRRLPVVSAIAPAYQRCIAGVKTSLFAQIEFTTGVLAPQPQAHAQPLR